MDRIWTQDGHMLLLPNDILFRGGNFRN